MEPLEVLPKPLQREDHDFFYGYAFGSSAPAESMPFPAHANLTVVKLLTFFPNSIRCADIIYRLISNGGIRQTIWAIINIARDHPVEFRQNSCGAWMYRAMKGAIYGGCTIQIHERFHEDKRASWNEANLDVAGLPPNDRKKKHTQPSGIRFSALAVNVRVMPQGDDALQLIRMVQYCMQKPHEPWVVPTGLCRIA